MADKVDTLEKAVAGFGRKGGELLIGGRTVSELAAEHGTPLYAYSRDRLRARHDELREALPPEVAITYAVKANPNVDVLRLLGPLYDGVDVASMGEMRRCLEAGIPAAKMSFTGPGKSPAELRFAISEGIGTLSVENERELDHCEAIAAELGREARILIRVNPAFELSSAGLKMGGGAKQFGIDSERVPEVIRRLAASASLRYLGIHIFAGVQNLSAESILSAYDRIMAYAGELGAETGVPVQVLNLGGGFGIPHHKGDTALDLPALGRGFRELVKRRRPEIPATRLKIELGRYIVGESGVYLARILYRKVSRGATFYIMDGGMHHYLAASGNISPSPIHRPMHVTVGNRLDGPRSKVNVVGPLCTPMDKFGLNLEMPEADEGDLVAVLNAGAYGYTMSPLGFLSHRPPAEVLV